ncbi:MAG: GNAT family N-acetyltransferase [Agarilytica sp.]
MEEAPSIIDLTQQPSWAPTIARWHHEEWLKNHSGLEGRARSAEHIAKKLAQREHSLAQHLNDDPLPTTFVAHRKEVPIGTVSLVYYQFTQDKRPSEWLTNLYVLPELRRQGVAGALLEHALQYACEHDLPCLMLYTSTSADFYRKRRWRTINKGIVQGLKVDIMDYKLR